MKAEQIIVPVAALVIGGALGYCLKPVPKPDTDETPAVRTEVKEVKLGLDTSSSTDALRHQIRDLQRQLAEARATEGEDGTAVPVNERRGRRARGERGDEGRGGWQERMERMRAENPEQYAEMTNRFAQFRLQRQARAQSKIDFFNAIDTTQMSEGDREVVQNLQDLLAKREVLESKFQIEGMTDEERIRLGQEVFAMERSIRESSGQVREALIKQTAEALGYSGEAVGEIASTLMEVIDMTESGALPGPPPGGFGRGGFPGGGRGGREGRGGRR